MRLLIQTKHEYVITEVQSVHYEKETDTLVVEDRHRVYRITILESRAYEFFRPLLEKGYVDLREFVCTVTDLSKAECDANCVGCETYCGCDQPTGQVPKSD